MKFSYQNKSQCINCIKEFIQINDFCLKCYPIISNEISILDQQFHITKYDLLQTQYVKKKYFEKYYHCFVKLLSNNTNIKIMNINSQYMRISILNNLLSRRDINLSVVFLTLNFFDPNHISYMIKYNDIKYINIDHIDKYTLDNLYGGIIMDPWNSHSDYIKDIYGNNGLIPNTTLDICQLWINNKLKAQQMLDNIRIKTCSICRYNICLRDLDILNAPNIPDNHSTCMTKYEIDELCNMMSNKIILHNFSMDYD
jgi:hypothetical protein